MNRRFTLSIPVRVAAGVLGAAILALNAWPQWRAAMGTSWKEALGATALSLLFLYGAFRGESPAWLEPRNGDRDLSDR